MIYRFDGFLQPINDTAHQIGTSTSIFKAGSTVPVKFQLRKADGTVVQAATAPVWLTPVKGSADDRAGRRDRSTPTSADSGSTYKWDATAQQYIYNWKTGTGGNYCRIGVTLDDGQTYYVNIGTALTTHDASGGVGSPEPAPPLMPRQRRAETVVHEFHPVIRPSGGGLDADLLAIAGDPFHNLDALQQVVAVFRGGVRVI